MNQYLYRCTITWPGPRLVINAFLWVIVFILTSGVLPEEHVWMAKWDHSTPLNRTRCCFYSRLCLTSDTASQKPFLTKFGCTVGVSKTLTSSWNSNCLLLATWMSLTQGQILTDIPPCQCLAKLWLFLSASRIIHRSIHIFIVTTWGLRIDSQKCRERSKYVNRRKGKVWKKLQVWLKSHSENIRLCCLVLCVTGCYSSQTGY